MRVSLSPEAENDLARIGDFNLQRSWEWAWKVQHRLSDQMRALAATPQLGRPVRARKYKRFSVTDIQYVIDYEPIKGGIRILRVRHSREVR